jgi:hypothetical protein
VRPSQLVAGAALTAALALVALPGIAGSRTPSPASIVDPVAFEQIQTSANAAGRPEVVEPLDPAYASEGRLALSAAFIEPGGVPERVITRPKIAQPAAHAGTAQKPPRYTLTGVATFYANGTTAMRLPRGTTVIICGQGGCIERIVNDYGPIAGTNRIVDLYTPDFFDVCGCPSWSGTTWVTVAVY